MINQKDIADWHDFPDEGHGVTPAPRAIVARMRCISVVKTPSAEQVNLLPVYSDDKSHPNYKWSQYTPAGSLNLMISNPDARGAFEVDKEYEVLVTQVLPC